MQAWQQNQLAIFNNEPLWSVSVRYSYRILTRCASQFISRFGKVGRLLGTVISSCIESVTRAQTGLKNIYSRKENLNKRYTNRPDPRIKASQARLGGKKTFVI